MTVMHENADKVRSRGVLPPFSQPQFLFHFILPPLLGFFHVNADHILREASSFIVAAFVSNTLQLLCPS